MNENEKTTNILSMKPIQVYGDYPSQLDKIENENKKLTFDYGSKKGNKEARSHIDKLRKTKTAIENKRKDYGRRIAERKKEVDDFGKGMITRVDSMIDIHKKPLDEIEEQEQKRIDGIRSKIARIEAYGSLNLLAMSSGEIKIKMDELEALEPDESFSEFMSPSVVTWKQIHGQMQTAYDFKSQQEKDAAELAALKARQETQSDPKNNSETTDPISLSGDNKGGPEPDETLYDSLNKMNKLDRPGFDDVFSSGNDVSSEVVTALMNNGISEKLANHIYNLIDSGLIPHVKII